MDLLQKQQARNLRSIQSAVPSLLDVDVLKSTNDKLETKVDNLSKKWKETEEQKAKIKEILSNIRLNLGTSDPSTIEKYIDTIEELTAPLPEIIEEEEEEEKKNEEAEDDVDMIKASEDDGEGSPKIVASVS